MSSIKISPTKRTEAKSRDGNRSNLYTQPWE